MSALDFSVKDVPLWLLVPSPPVMAYYTGLLLSGGHPANVMMRTAYVELAVMTAFRFLTCAAYVVEHDFALDPLLFHAIEVITLLSSSHRHC